MQTIIVDDEKPSRDNLEAIIKEYFPELIVLGSARNVEGAYNLINQLKPDLVFLDIELGFETGFDLLNRFGSLDFEVIFITAYEDYAVKAFRTKAVDYLLKPIDIDHLKDAIIKVSENIKFKKTKKVSDLKENVSLSANTGNNFLRVSSDDGAEFISFDDIIYFRSDNYYTNIVLENGRTILSTKTLKDYEQLIKSLNFYRIHNSYIINIKFLKSVVVKEEYFAQLNNNMKITISRRRKDDFLRFLEINKPKATKF